MWPLEDRLRIEDVEKFQPDAELQTKLDVRGKRIARQKSRNAHGRVLGID